MSKPILRLERVATRKEIGAMGRHWHRTQPTPNADPDMVGGVRLLHGSGDVLADLDAQLATLDKPPRKDACLGIEVLASASEDYFRPDGGSPYSRDPAKIEAWVRATMEHLRAEHGSTLAAAVLHLDETTPHIQALVVPIVEKMRAPAGRAKDRTPRLTRSLSADTVMGNRDALSDRQERYDRAMDALGIGDRTPRDHDTPPRTTVRQWYARQERATDAIERSAEQAAASTTAIIAHQTAAAGERVSASRDRAVAARELAEAASARAMAQEAAQAAQAAAIARQKDAAAAQEARLEAERAASRQKALTTVVEATLDGRITGAPDSPPQLRLSGSIPPEERASLADAIRPAGRPGWAWVRRYFERTEQEREKVRDQVRRQTLAALERPRAFAASLASRLRRAGHHLDQAERQEIARTIAEANTVAPRMSDKLRPLHEQITR